MPEIPDRNYFLLCAYKKSSAKEESTAFCGPNSGKIHFSLGGEVLLFSQYDTSGWTDGSQNFRNMTPIALR